jgi:hypothetical protein
MFRSARFPWFQSANRHQKKPSLQRRPYCLRLEALEDRTLLSTLTVLNNADHGANSLRDTIAAAHSGDTIQFAPSLSNQTIKLTTGELVISKNLSIMGLGADKLTISGQSASRVFHIEPESNVTLANMTIADGQSTGELPASVAGIYSGTDSGAGGGGGILNEFGATLTLENDAVSNNEAVGSVGFTVLGGGLLNLGTAKVLDSQFSNNKSVGGGAADNIGGSGGGAIEDFGGPNGGSALTVANTSFINNRSVAAGGGYYFGLGGAVENDSGLNGYNPALAEGSTAVLTHCSFLSNLVTGGPDAIGNGGAINNEGLGTTLTCIACGFIGNRSVGGGGGDGVTTGDSEGVAGAIMNGFSTLNVSDCVIAGNQAIGGNNTILSAADPLAGSGFGGGVENNFSGTLIISDSLIAGNLAVGGATSSGPGGDAVGGGISNSPQATMKMTNCIVAANIAVAGHGGPGVNALLGSVPGGFAFGGGIDTSNSGSSATIIGSLIAGNQAVGGTGGAGNNGGNGFGGGLSVGFGSLIGFTDGSQLTLIDTVVAGNLAEGGIGGAGANGGDGLGGGLYVGAGCSATLTDSVIEDNVADGGDAGSHGHEGRGIGGGVYRLGAYTADASSVVKNNQASASNDDLYP